MRVGIKTALALVALFAILIHGIVEMSEEIKNNLISSQYNYEIRR